MLHLRSPGDAESGPVVLACRTALQRRACLDEGSDFSQVLQSAIRPSDDRMAMITDHDGR